MIEIINKILLYCHEILLSLHHLSNTRRNLIYMQSMNNTMCLLKGIINLCKDGRDCEVLAILLWGYADAMEVLSS